MIYIYIIYNRALRSARWPNVAQTWNEASLPGHNIGRWREGQVGRHQGHQASEFDGHSWLYFDCFQFS